MTETWFQDASAEVLPLLAAAVQTYGDETLADEEAVLTERFPAKFHRLLVLRNPETVQDRAKSAGAIGA